MYFIGEALPGLLLLLVLGDPLMYPAWQGSAGCGAALSPLLVPSPGAAQCGTTELYLGKAGLSVKHRGCQVSQKGGLYFLSFLKIATFTCSCNSQHEPVPKSHSSPLRGSYLSPACSCPQGRLHCSWGY